MSAKTIVQDFLYRLEPEDVPLEYISAASILDREGKEVVLRGEELRMLMENHPDYEHVKDARVYIDIRRVVGAVNLEVEFIHDRVSRMMDADETNSL